MSITTYIAYDMFSFIAAAVAAHYLVIPAIDKIKKNW